MYEVAVTGIGIVSSIGCGIKKVTESLMHGISGIKIDPIREEMGFRGVLTGTIDDFVIPKIDRKKRKTMTDFGLQAFAATLDALEMCGWEEDELRSSETGLIIGNDSAAIANIESVDINCKNKSTFPIGAARVFQSLNSTVTINLNTLLGNKGASWTISGACASGSHSIGQASDLIALGRQKRVICGGVQEINWQSLCSFDATNAFSIRKDDPKGASRPFDIHRDGLVPSGGAAIVILERYDLAMKRGADILGKILSYSFSSDGYRLSVPSSKGLQLSMIDCIKRSGVKLNDIDYICAHATSTPVGDIAEAQAINNVFGNNTPWISSTKSMTGHEMWMSGSAQIVYSILMGKNGFIAPNINFEKMDTKMPPLKIASETIDFKPKIVLTNSAGFGGTNACLMIEVH